MTEALADFAGIDVTRALIADPALPEKWMAGKEAEIVPCILCKQGCHTHANTNPVIACSMNPQAGVEYRQGSEEKREKASWNNSSTCKNK